MNRTDLDARNMAAIRKHSRALADTDGKAGRALLDDLAAIADEHAADSTRNATATGHASVIAANDDEADMRHWRGDAVNTPATRNTAEVTTGTGSAVLGGPAGPIEPDRSLPVSPSARTRTRTRGGPK